ncbi:putative mitochondrial protein, partial [Mucuna pruriens]
MLDYKLAGIPMEQNQKLNEKGKLIYLSHTHLDIAYVNPSERHLETVIRILCYLKSALGRGIMFSKNNHLDVEGYTDANWVGSVFDRKYTSIYFTFVGVTL